MINWKEQHELFLEYMKTTCFLMIGIIAVWFVGQSSVYTPALGWLVMFPALYVMISTHMTTVLKASKKLKENKNNDQKHI